MKPTLRELGLNPRALGTNPKALGTNPRALGINPKALRQKELEELRKFREDYLAKHGGP